VLPAQVPTRHAKRVIDIVLAAAGLLLLSVLIVVVAIAIKLDSRGPIFCRKTLYGYGHRNIRALKFRSMTTCTNADRSSSTVTRVGRVLRQTGIDELPQLFNVLLGDMSIVGPRAFASRLDLPRGHVMALEEFSPGMTGRAQLMESWEGLTTAEQRRDEDLHYVENWSLLLDLKIVLMTVFSQKPAASRSPEL